MRAKSKSIGQDAGGYFVEIYTDDDAASGYGDNARVGRWYGTLAECEAMAPERVRLYRWRYDDRDIDPFDVAEESGE